MTSSSGSRICAPGPLRGTHQSPLDSFHNESVMRAFLYQPNLTVDHLPVIWDAMTLTWLRHKYVIPWGAYSSIWNSLVKWVAFLVTEPAKWHNDWCRDMTPAKCTRYNGDRIRVHGIVKHTLCYDFAFGIKHIWFHALLTIRYGFRWAVSRFMTKSPENETKHMKKCLSNTCSYHGFIIRWLV